MTLRGKTGPEVEGMGGNSVFGFAIHQHSASLWRRPQTSEAKVDPMAGPKRDSARHHGVICQDRMSEVISGSGPNHGYVVRRRRNRLVVWPVRTATSVSSTVRTMLHVEFIK